MKILHITDLHIGWEERIENEKQIWDRLFREISETVNENKIDMLAVTGDLVMHGTKEEYQRVEMYLHHLRKILALNKNQVFFAVAIMILTLQMQVLHFRSMRHF